MATAQFLATKKVEKVEGGVLVTEASLDDIILNARRITSERNFVPGNKTFSAKRAVLKGLLKSARAVSAALINDGHLDKDKYTLLGEKTRAFGSHNDLANEILAELREEELQDRAIEKEVSPEKPQEPFTEAQKGNIQGNPSEDPDTHMADETTADGGRMQFDKVNFKIYVHLTDGGIRVIDLAPEGSWRQTIGKWLVAFCDAIATVTASIAKKISNGVDTVLGWFSKKKPEATVNKHGEVKSTADLVEAAAKKVATQEKPETPKEEAQDAKAETSDKATPKQEKTAK